VTYRFVFAVFAAALACGPAQAQPASGQLPAHEVATIVTSMGLRMVGRPAWAGGRYVAAAVDRHGRELNVVVDAFDGQVIAVRPIGRNGFGPPPDEEWNDGDNRRQASREPARAPRDITGAVRVPPAPRKQATPTQTPTPRPRPAFAKADDQAKPVSSKPGASETDAKPPEAAPAAVPEPGAAPEASAEANAEAKPEGKPEAKPETKSAPASKAAATPQPAKPAKAKGQSKDPAKPEAGKDEIRVIDLSKPKDAEKPEDKPGQAIRF